MIFRVLESIFQSYSKKIEFSRKGEKINANFLGLATIFSQFFLLFEIAEKFISVGSRRENFFQFLKV